MTSDRPQDKAGEVSSQAEFLSQRTRFGIQRDGDARQWRSSGLEASIFRLESAESRILKDLVWDPLKPEKKKKQGKGINLGLNGILGTWNKLIAHPHKCIPDGQ